MRIAIHQPNFLPWMGYFYKMAQSDVFVLLNHVEYTKQSFTKRVKIHKPNNLHDEQYITIALKKHSDFSSIESLQLADTDKWQKKIAAQIHQSYHKAPYYHQIEPLIEQFFLHPLDSNSFSAYTSEIIKYIAEMMDLKPKWFTSSELEIEYSGSDVNLDIVSFLGGQTYISGMGAKKYIDESSYEAKNINILYSDFPDYFKNLDLPDQFLNKSILSYLACLPIKDIKHILNGEII